MSPRARRAAGRYAMTSDARALLIHPNPDPEMLEALLTVCERLIVLSSMRNPRVRVNDRITWEVCEDEERIVESACRLCLEEKVQIVPPLWEGVVEATSIVSAALGLPGNSPQAARASRDKYEASLCFKAGGVPHPRTALFDGDDPVTVEREFTYPFIVKLPRSTNSQSVSLVRSRGQLRMALAAVARLYSGDSSN